MTVCRISSSYLHLALNIIPSRCQGGIVQISLSANNHPASARKVEVRRGLTEINLADQFTRGIPDLNTIAAASIDISPGVAVDA